uniref:Uncharacterized protein n=1 Tax=Arundo donax TaxID=35708 RepID=A0A0A9FWH4_ARUDO
MTVHRRQLCPAAATVRWLPRHARMRGAASVMAASMRGQSQRRVGCVSGRRPWCRPRCRHRERRRLLSPAARAWFLSAWLTTSL